MNFEELEVRLSQQYENIKVFEDTGNIMPKIYVACNFEDDFIFVVSEYKDSEIGGEFERTDDQTTEEMWNDFNSDVSISARQVLINHIEDGSAMVIGKNDNRVLH